MFTARNTTTPLRNGALKVMLMMALGVVNALPQVAIAQAYPSKPIRLIIPFPPGGGTDILGRVIGAKLAESIGQQVIVENRPGAGGNLGTAMAATAPGDGYTILMVSASYTVNAAVFKLNFDPLKDLIPIIQVATVPFVLTATPSLPANNVKELIALAKAKPGSLNFASSGNGSSPHLAGELLTMMTDTKMVHVPYKGGGPAATDVMSGQVQLLFSTVTTSAGQIKAGRMKALGIASLKRSSSLPDIPTLHESGVPDFDVTNWFGILAPSSTPKPIVALLNKHINGLITNPDVRAKLVAEGADPVGGSAEDFDKLIRADIAKYVGIVKAANIKVD